MDALEREPETAPGQSVEEIANEGSDVDHDDQVTRRPAHADAEGTVEVEWNIVLEEALEEL